MRAVNEMREAERNIRSGQVVDAAMRVHSRLGPGLLEGAYEACLAHELRTRGLLVARQVQLPVEYDGAQIALGYRIDLLIDNVVVVEVKAVAKTTTLHEAQVLSYLKLGGYPIGLLINFHVSHLKDGITRFVNDT
ncbi:MAG: GxxExxY protein [bacterium]